MKNQITRRLLITTQESRWELGQWSVTLDRNITEGNTYLCRVLGDTKDEVESMSQHIAAIPEMITAIEAYQSLQNSNLPVADLEQKLEELQDLMKTAFEKATN